jgi:hypothetical protein
VSDLEDEEDGGSSSSSSSNSNSNSQIQIQALFPHRKQTVYKIPPNTPLQMPTPTLTFNTWQGAVALLPPP